MSHPFGDLVSQHLHRKHGLSQSKLAAGVLQPPTIITAMCKGKRLTGPRARERVVAIIRWLHQQGTLDMLGEANTLLNAAGMAALYDSEPAEAALTHSLRSDAQYVAERRTPRPAVNLPAPLTSLIGRAREMTDIKRLLGVNRLVTLIGAPGIGKTRLALQTVLDLSDPSLGYSGPGSGQAFSDGAAFIQLAPIHDAELVLPTIAQHLHVPQAPGRSTLEQLIAHLRNWHFLLALDNFEQVAPAAVHLAEVLAAAPHLTLLVTSRVALNLSGEQRFAVPTLATPDAHALASHSSPEDALLRYAATRLFLERARAITPGFTPNPADARAIAHICQRLDGLPLAIELAAARILLFSPQELLARLDRRLAVLTDGAVNLPERQRTLRNAIQWSYDLLDAEEQQLFRRLSVFAGGWTLEAAEAVGDGRQRPAEAGEGLETGDSLSLVSNLQSLIAKSLVKQDDVAGGDIETRFDMLETLREYALGRLEEGGEAEVIRQRHASFFVDFAERVQPNMNSDERKVWYARFDAEQDNFRAALAWTLATGHAELGLRLAGRLGEYWFWWSSHWHEGWAWISQLLALPEAVRPTRARAHALRAAVNLLRYLGDNAKADRLAEESLALLRELGDKAGVAWVLADKGWAAGIRADYMEEVRLCEESAALFRVVGDQRGLGWALTWAAVARSRQGKFEEASGLFGSALAALRQAGDEAMASVCILNLTVQAYDSADYERADVLAHEALALCRKRGDPNGENYALTNLARIALARGDLERAAAQLTASEAWFRQARQTDGLCQVLHDLGYVRHLQGNDRAAGALLHEALALHRQQQQTLLLIESLERCAWIAADRGRPEQAARLFGAAEAARERIGAPLPLGDKPLYDRHLARARADLDEPAFDAAWNDGRVMTLDEAVAYALDEL